jgi:hypothetical protein
MLQTEQVRWVAAWTRWTALAWGLVIPAIGAAQRAPTVPSAVRVEVSRSWGARSVQPREALDGAITGVNVQFAHGLGRGAGFTWSYLLEATPFMAVRLGASPERLQQIGPGLRPLYTVRHGVGGGVAPLGVQLSRALGARTRAQFEFAGGGAMFSTVVPYGDDGTRTNFTATTRFMLERHGDAQRAWAVGYALYHISNGGFGRANPGINARMLVVRYTHTTTP